MSDPEFGFGISVATALYVNNNFAYLMIKLILNLIHLPTRNNTMTLMISLSRVVFKSAFVWLSLSFIIIKIITYLRGSESPPSILI